MLVSCTKCSAICRERLTAIKLAHIFRHHLRESFLLQIRDDALTQERRSLDDIQHFFVVVFEKSELESILSWVEGDGARAGRAIETVDSFSFDTGQVDWVVQCADHTMITATTSVSMVKVKVIQGDSPLSQAVFDMVQR